MTIRKPTQQQMADRIKQLAGAREAQICAAEDLVATMHPNHEHCIKLASQRLNAHFLYNYDTNQIVG